MLARNRALAVPLGIVAAVILFYMVNPWFFPEAGSTARTVATVAFWVLMIAVLVLLFEDRKSPQAETVEVEGPAFTRYLFGNTRAGLIWLPIRLFLGFEWAVAGWEKITGTGWTDGGAALLGYWKSAVAIPTTGHAAITFEWYRTFLQFLIDHNAQTWMGWVVSVGELAVGIGLLLGVADRDCRLLRGDDEHVLHAGRLGLGEPDHVRLHDRADPGLEGRRLLRLRPLPAAAPGRALAPGQADRDRSIGCAAYDLSESRFLNVPGDDPRRAL